MEHLRYNAVVFIFQILQTCKLILPQDILCLAEARLSHTSSAAVCRKLSSVGRRVLSIESVSTFQGAFHHLYHHVTVWPLLRSLLVLIDLFAHPQTDRKAPGKRGGSIQNPEVCLRDWALTITPKTSVSRVLLKLTVCPGSR